MDTVGLAASLVFAIPVGIFALDQLLTGDRMVGAILLVVAVLMVVIPRRLTTPQDIPGKVVERAVGSVVTDPDEKKREE